MQASSANSHFPHRVNEDGMIDSICPHCFVTIGSSTCESDLAKMESAHVCDPALVRYYKQREEADERSQPRGSLPRTERRSVA